MENNRTKALLSHFSGDAVLITGRKNRYYYSGFTGTEAALLLTRDENYIFTDSRYFIQAREQARGFTLVDTAKQKPSELICARGFSHVGFEDEAMTVSELRGLEQKMPGVTLTGVSAAVGEQRRIKDANEISCVRRAAEIADRAFSYILGELRPGRTERELALRLEFFMREQDADGLSFDTIFASGVRSAMPHGTASEKKIEVGDFVTMDFGCLYRGYASDMTRTVVMGKASARQREIYSTVLDAQKAALRAVRPGVAARAVDAAGRDVIAAAGYGECFGHSLGHSLGLDIHERPTLSPRSGDILAPGMFVTDEPGIYIEGFGGVRIEDLLLVTDSGCENFVSSEKELLEI